MNGEQDRVMSPCDTALWSLIDRYFATTQDVFESSSIATTKGAFTIPSTFLFPAFEHTWGGAGVLNAVESKMQVYNKYFGGYFPIGKNHLLLV